MRCFVRFAKNMEDMLASFWKVFGNSLEYFKKEIICIAFKNGMRLEYLWKVIGSPIECT